MKTCKYFTKELLLEAGQESIDSERNRQLDLDVLQEHLDEELRYPVTFEFPHNDVEMRVKIQLGPFETDVGWLDIPFETYSDLPEIEMFGATLH
tara:strand:+ start:1466 stop:1747 length:282 start_codon:yes stop_codon:yes gene_type:complete